MKSNLHNLDILYEDNHLIAVNKRVGDLVQGDKTGDIPLPDLVKAYLKAKYQKPGAVFLGVVHRLDRPTSGVVVFARTSKALSRMNRLFAEKDTQKTYWALVENTRIPESGELQHWLVRNTKQNKSYAHHKEVPNAKKARLFYTIRKRLERYQLLEIDLLTGRHHQIRAQLNAIGAHIKGDLKYGAKRSNPDGGICLHARKLCFTHPVKKEPICIEAPVPPTGIWQQIS
ncbi:RluA family pseudouridine synthase [Sediminicola luteus]|uniref:RNA pseudouridine synthase n=1 Tax=Sediminicola luteus TaxID=319238 RepID=A0A2A4G814_9FLAO|nr:RluA family pseudouridine synthase [Sediminicola luteus]PCE63895.1 RNA pseudouridine synthase [Sediminicola luteus]